MTEAFPGEGTTATVVVKADARTAEAVAAALAELEAGAAATDRLRRRRAGPGRGLRRTARRRCSGWRCRTTSPTTRVDTRDRAAADRPGAGRARRPRRRVRRRRRRRRVARLREPAAGPAAARDRLRAPADPADDGRSRSAACRSRWSRRCSTWRRSGSAFGILTLVFQHGWFESALDFTQPGLRDRLDPAVRDGGPGRAVDGLPRVRAQPGARARPPGPADDGWRSSGASATPPAW